MRRNTKTHYMIVRVVFDKPCDERTAVKGAKFGLQGKKDIPARAFHAKYYHTDPTTFRVARVMPR